MISDSCSCRLSEPLTEDHEERQLVLLNNLSESVQKFGTFSRPKGITYQNCDVQHKYIQSNFTEEETYHLMGETMEEPMNMFTIANGYDNIIMKHIISKI